MLAVRFAAPGVAGGAAAALAGAGTSAGGAAAGGAAGAGADPVALATVAAGDTGVTADEGEVAAMGGVADGGAGGVADGGCATPPSRRSMV